MKYFFYGLDIVFSGIIMYILYPFLPDNIWIISEREDQAQDNGIAFFEYLNKEHKDIKSFYLLSNSYSGIDEVKKIGNVLIKGSLKHKIYFLRSKVTAFTEKNIIEPWGSRIFYRTFAKIFPNKLKVFLQHGILDKDVSSVYGKYVSNIDIFVTSTTVESTFVEEKFGYNKNEIANVGISRYDKLIDYNKNNDKEKIILYIPTWRRDLFDLANKNDSYIIEARENFLKSEYYEKIQELINDKRLGNILKQNNYKFIFVTHHGINELNTLFTSDFNEVEIYKSEEVNIAQLLAKTNVFLTDYSSIHFDSAYIGNRNIYYQFDKDMFFNIHAGKSYFNYEKDGFGPVVQDLDTLILEIDKAVNNTNESKYIERADKFFQFKDKKNCCRLYNFIKNTLDRG